MPGGFLGLLLLLHLAGAFRQMQPYAQMPTRQKPQAAPNPTAPAISPAMSPKGVQSAQGPQGMGQGYHGAQAPMLGGVGSMRNQAGLYPHQTNPFSFMAGLR